MKNSVKFIVATKKLEILYRHFEDRLAHKAFLKHSSHTVVGPEPSNTLFRSSQSRVTLPTREFWQYLEIFFGCYS